MGGTGLRFCQTTLNRQTKEATHCRDRIDAECNSPIDKTITEKEGPKARPVRVPEKGSSSEYEDYKIKRHGYEKKRTTYQR